MTDEIVLPCGVKLALVDDAYPRYEVHSGELLIGSIVRNDPTRAHEWDAFYANNGEWLWHATREECIAWLDAKVLELRSALLPADARERVAKWLVDRDANRYGGSWVNAPECNREDARGMADDLLSALGLGR